MSIIQELLSLREEVLAENITQSIIKKFAVPIGTMKEVFGDGCDLACGLLQCTSKDIAYELKKSSPKLTGVVKSLLGKAHAEDNDEPVVVRLIGARKVLAWKGRIITSKEQFDSLVESVKTS